MHSQPNGSHITTGIIGDIYNKKVDIGVAPFGLNLERAIHVDYLTLLTPLIVGIYVEQFKAIELVDLQTFTAPFTLKLQITILTASVFITIIKIITRYSFSSITIIETISFLWTSLIANFGGAPSSMIIDANQSYKLTIFVSLCCGIVIWISYQAELTSELSTIDKEYPFTDLESFSKTNWK